jgi:hypothetical protein
VRRAYGSRSSSSALSSFDMGTSCGEIVCSSIALNSLTMGSPSDEYDERGDGGDLGELSFSFRDAELGSLRPEDEGPGMTALEPTLWL